MKKVLIVEDDDVYRKLLAGKLANSYEIVQAVDGESAVTEIVDKQPDLILLDLMLPKLDGFKVLERIRRYPDAKISSSHVVVLSNLWSQKDILQIQGLKVDDYFIKAHTKIEDVVNRVGGILS